MPRCEDYPCCGHGPAPLGDGGGCPDSQGRYKCVLCYATLPRDYPSAICERCATRRSRYDLDEYDDGRSGGGEG